MSTVNMFIADIIFGVFSFPINDSKDSFDSLIVDRTINLYSLSESDE